MVAATSVTAAAASIVGHRVQTTSLESTSAATTYHRKTVDDPSFIAPGAEAFERDLPGAEIHLFDAGHFALDEKNDEIAGLIPCVLGQTFGLIDRMIIPRIS